MLKIEYTARMRRDIKRVVKRGKDIKKLESVLEILARKKTLPEKCKDHRLSGKFNDFKECHIEPDWLLMYKIIENELILSATATGTHADLFGM